MTKIITFTDGTLDCYAKSIQNFIEYLRNDINTQSQKCKNNKNYDEEQLKIISEIQEKAKNDDFIINYFNNNGYEKVINIRKDILKEIIKKDSLLKNFECYIIKKGVTNFYYNYDFLQREDFISQREKLVLNSGNNREYFDEVLISKEDNNHIYIEYKKDLIFLYILPIMNDKEVIDKEKNIYESLQNLSKIVTLERISKNDVVNKMLGKKENENFHVIKIDSSGGSFRGKENEERISQNFFVYLNEEINKRIIADELFKSYLKTF